MVDDALVPSLSHAADVLAFPSLHKGFGLAALEALAAGVPVVAANTAPFTDFLGTESAELVDPLSAAAIHAGLVRALGAPKARAARGLEVAQSYSWERSAVTHAEQYRRALATRNVRSLAPAAEQRPA